ncbi:MAG: carbohydrate deacetylase [Pseudomonadota bacterium]
MGVAGRATRLVVNADDFGAFDRVSAGILDAIRAGAVTATGVMANGEALDRWLRPLLAEPGADVGIHLNATFGRPLTASLRRRFRAYGGEFPPKELLLARLVTGSLPVGAIADEWRAQIRRCRLAGVRPSCRNSPEHVHAFPALARVALELAREFASPYVRAPGPEWRAAASPASHWRSAALALARRFDTGLQGLPLLGLSASGRIDDRYLAWRLPRLAPGGVYELMCHPGHRDPAAVADPRLSAYHDWEGELRALTGGVFAELRRRHRIELVRYSDLAVQSCTGLAS